MTRTLIFILLGVAAGACGSGFGAKAYEQTVAQLQVAIDTHRSAAAASRVQDCTAELEKYDHEARSLLKQLTNASVGIDSCRRAMGHPGPFDARSVCDSMQGELDRHVATACTGDESANRAEVTRHCDLMRNWASRQRVEAASIMSMGSMMVGDRCTP